MSENKRFLEGCEKLADGRYRIREKMTVIPIKCKEPITEKIIVEGKEVSPKHKYTLMIWDNKPNGNLRNYQFVIDRVIEENRPTFCLADHPQDGCEADSARVCGCGKNYRKMQNWLVADVYLFGPIGDTLAQGFDLGVPINCSSSVLGTLDNEGNVINDSTFYLERICDILGVGEFPSNGIYHYQDHCDKIGNDDYSFETISEQGFKESLNKEVESVKENLTINNKESNIVESSEKEQNDKADEKENNEEIGEDKMPENTMNELAEQSMILNIKSMIRDADKATDLFEKKSALISADGFAKKLSESSLHDEICKKIEDTDEEIKALSKKGLETDDLAEKCKALEDEVAKVNGELETLKKEKDEVENKLKTLTDMYEDEQFKASQTELDKNVELEEKNHRLSKELCSLKAKNRNLEGIMKRNRRVLESKMNKLEAESNTMVDADVVSACNKKIKKLESENADLCKKIEDLETTIETLKRANEAEVVDANVEEVLSLKKKLNEMIAKNNRLRRFLNEQRMSNLEKKESRFSKLKKTLEDDEVIVDDEIIEDEIADDEIIVNDNGIEVEENDDSEDSFMEKALAGTL